VPHRRARKPGCIPGVYSRRGFREKRNIVRRGHEDIATLLTNGVGKYDLLANLADDQEKREEALETRRKLMDA
jgi:hypothetical protein